MFFHPASINLENLVFAGPVALWGVHQQIPERKRLSMDFWKTQPNNDSDPPLQTFLGVVQIPAGVDDSVKWEEPSAQEMVTFGNKASQRLFKRKYMVAPPMVLFDTLDPHADEDPLSHSLVGHIHDAMIQLAGEDYEAQIEESEDSLTLTICADTGACMESPFPYAEKGLIRAEAFMMIYDALKIAGVGATILNDEKEDDDDDSDTPFITH